MSKLQKILDTIDLKELREIEKELSTGVIQSIIEKRLSQLELQEKTCPVCNKPVFMKEAFILELHGPHDFRQRATFDGLDCMEYFITHMKKMKQQEDEYF